jgi:O-antigen ligase
MGRLFVWEVSANAIKDKPIFGHGIDSFAAKHNMYQANYFANNPDYIKNAYLADCVKFSFNEFIQITFEIGIVGLILFLLLLYFGISLALNHKNNINNTLSLKMGLGMQLALIICSLLSYPIHLAPSLFLFFISLLFINSGIKHNIFVLNLSWNISKRFSIIGFFLIVIWVGYSIKRYQAEKKWKIAYTILHQGRVEEALQLYGNISNTMKYNPYFGYNYGAELSVLGQAEKSLKILNPIENKVCDADYYFYLGLNFENINDLENALRSYNFASDMMPIKYIPKYKMVKINLLLGREAEALRIANNIVNMPIKVESSYVKIIRHEMAQLILSYGNEK